MKKIFLSLMMFAFFGATETFAQCLQTNVHPDTADANTWAVALIDSLGQAELSNERNPPDQPAKSFEEMISQITAQLTAAKLAKNDLICAARIIEPFSESKDGMLGAASSVFSQIYMTLAALHNQIIETIQANVSGQAGLDLDKMSDLGVRFQNTWETLGKTTVVSMEALIQDQAAGTLKVTEQQRLSLIRSIEKSFGKESPAEAAMKGSIAKASAALLRQFLVTWKGRKL